MKDFSQTAADRERVVDPEEGLALLQRVRKLLLVGLGQKDCRQADLKKGDKVRQMCGEHK